ncbi:hypothetical protein Tco_0896665 [Tanacetum coccineum]
MLDGGSDVGDGGRRDKAILHMLCVLDGLLDVLVKGVKLVEFLLNLVSSHEWLGLSTQPTPKEKVKALGANGDVSGSRVGVVCMEVSDGIVRARLVSRVVVKVMLMVLIGWEVFVRWFWMGELSLEEMSMKLVRGIFFGGFWVEELALEAIEYDDQGMGYEEGSFSTPCEELEKVNRMTQIWKELELGDETFFPHA